MRIQALLGMGLLVLWTAASAADPTVSRVAASDDAGSDPVRTDGDKYKVLLDNARVRVLSYADEPGQKTHEHRHPAFVLYALAPFKRRLTLADGRVLAREFRPGEVFYSNGEGHLGENIGETPTRVIMIELK